MLHAYIRGRLGNQLFQYAFVRMLQYHNPGVGVCYHFDEVYSAGTPEQDFVNSLKHYHVVDVREGKEQPRLSFIQKLLMKLYWLPYPHTAPVHIINRYQMKWVGLLSRFGLYYLDLGYYHFPKKLPKGDVIVSGNFESEEYFYEIKEQILDEVKPLKPISAHNQALLKLMQETNSVSLSIRRGDFVEDAKISGQFNVCTPKYYQRAVEYIKQHVENPVLFIFSNDVEWCKQHLDFGLETHYESGKDPSWEAMELMSHCRHNIMANSSYNWWAQYKSPYQDKVVVAPARWWNSPFRPAIFQEHWHLIEVD